MIKVGDRSEHGWSTVDEYVEDELPDDRRMRNDYLELRLGLDVK